jgi:hypothetical protein
MICRFFMGNYLVGTGLALLAMAGCPVSRESVQQRLSGNWGDDSIIVHFNQYGVLDSYGRETELYRDGRSVVHDLGVLTDFTQAPVFRDNGFTTVLSRSLTIGDVSYTEQVVADGELIGADRLRISFDCVDGDSFYGASVGDGTWDLERLPSER